MTCLPDPIGFLYHSAIFIQSNLKPSSTPDHVPDSGSEWRHQLIQLVLEDEPGLAATSGGKIHVSLQWVESVMKDVHSSKRDTQAAIKEFKGVRQYKPLFFNHIQGVDEQVIDVISSAP